MNLFKKKIQRVLKKNILDISYNRIVDIIYTCELFQKYFYRPATHLVVYPISGILTGSSR